jgi:vitamin B12 transporter
MNTLAALRRVPATGPLALASAISLALVTSAYAAESVQTPQVLVTASRLPQPASDVLSDHQIISAEEIANAGQVSVAELLQKTHGIEITSNGGAGTVTSVLMRGTTNAQSIVLVDGVRIGSSTLGGATWSAIPLSQIDHIEIVYGPLSSLYGADAMGGVIQIFTRQGTQGIAPNATFGVGSFGKRTLDAGVAGGSAEHALRYALQTAREQSDEFSASKPSTGPYTYNPDRDGYTRTSASGSVSFAPVKGAELGMRFLHSRLASQFDAGPDYDDRMVSQLETLTLYGDVHISDIWRSKVQLSRSADKSASDASYGKDRANTTQTDVQFQNDLTIGTDLLQLVLEHRNEDVDADAAELTRGRSSNSVAGAYQLKRGPHLATLSVRDDSNSQYGSNRTGNLAYGYRLGAALRVNASYGTSFRAPTFNDLYFPGYGVSSNRPEYGRNAEAGLVYTDGAARLTASVYRNRVTDLIDYAPVCPVEVASHPYGCAYNIKSATLSGLSLGGTKAFDNVDVRGSLDFDDPSDDSTGLRLARRAQRHASAGLAYTLGPLKAGVEGVFSGARFNDSANATRLGGYGIINLTASYAINADWSVFGRWNNVGNKDYELASGYATAGRNLFVGVRYGRN